MILTYAGGEAVQNGVIDAGSDNTDYSSIRQIGPITETSPNSGIFEFVLPLEYTDGPASSTCPDTDDNSYDSLTDSGITGTVISRFDSSPSSGHYCIQTGDIITVEYTDPSDASGHVNTVSDSATFDLANGVIAGTLMVGNSGQIELSDSDFDLDSGAIDSIDSRVLGLYTKYGDLPINGTLLTETDINSGVFTSTVTIPKQINQNKMYAGDVVTVKFDDWGKYGGKYVGQSLRQISSDFTLQVELPDINFSTLRFSNGFDFIDTKGNFYQISDGAIKFTNNLENTVKTWNIPSGVYYGELPISVDSKNNVFFKARSLVNYAEYLMKLDTTTNEFIKFDGIVPNEIAVDYADNVVLGFGGNIGLLFTQTQVLKQWDLNCSGIVTDSGNVYCKNGNVVYRLNTITNEKSEWDMPLESTVNELAIDKLGNIYFTYFDGNFKIGKISTSDNLVTLWTSPIVGSSIKVNSVGNVFFGGKSLTELITSDDLFLQIPFSNIIQLPGSIQSDKSKLKMTVNGFTDYFCGQIFIDVNDDIYCSGVINPTKIIIKS